jgi:hypothetical protein
MLTSHACVAFYVMPTNKNKLVRYGMSTRNTSIQTRCYTQAAPMGVPASTRTESVTQRLQPSSCSLRPQQVLG